MLKMIVLVGISGSGKSTKAKEILNEADKVENYVYISSDEIRKNILGDENDQTQNDRVFKHVHNQIKDALKNEKNIIVDATNITIKSRKAILNNISTADKEKYTVIAYVLTTSVNLCLKRIEGRARKVPDEVVYKQVKKFEIPFYEEGFDEIILDNWEYLWEKKKLVNFPTLQDVTVVMMGLMHNFDQQTKHHKYTLDKHCQKVCEELQKVSSDNVLIRAGIVHDIGKLYTKQLKKDGSGDYCYCSHHNVGAYSLLQNIDEIAFPEKDKTLDLLFYVNYHMQPFFMDTEKSKNKWKSIYGEKKFNNLMLFNECDKRGSGVSDLL